MKQCMDADNLHRRLKKIIGQVQAIDTVGGDIDRVALLGQTFAKVLAELGFVFNQQQSHGGHCH